MFTSYTIIKCDFRSWFILMVLFSVFLAVRIKIRETHLNYIFLQKFKLGCTVVEAAWNINQPFGQVLSINIVWYLLKFSYKQNEDKKNFPFEKFAQPFCDKINQFFDCSGACDEKFLCDNWQHSMSWLDWG